MRAVQDPDARGGDLRGAVWIDQHAQFPLQERFAGCIHIPGQDRAAAPQRLQKDNAESLLLARHREQVAKPVEVRKFAVGNEARK